MARQRTDADNIRAGLFLIVALVAALTVVMILAGVGDKLKSRTRYIVYFPLGSDPAGLEVDSQVLVNGRPVGVVDRIHLELDPAGERDTGTYFEILVDRKVRFYGAPTAYLNRPLLGAGATLNFPNIGAVGAAPVADANEVFRGAIAPPSFLAEAGFGPQQQEQVQDILTRGSAFATELESMVRDFRANIYPRFEQIVGETDTRLGNWFDAGDRIVSNVDLTAGKLPDIADAAHDGISEIRAAVASAQEIVNETRPGVLETVENSRQASERFNTLAADLQRDTKPTIDGMLTDARAAMERARTAVERADALLAESSPALRRTVANARLASDQLKFTLEEVRRSPWRLLYRPDTRELEFELLYDAARIYAQSVSDLRDASSSLEAASAAQASAPSSLATGRAEELSAELDRAFAAYREAERAFLDLIIERGGDASGR